MNWIKRLLHRAWARVKHVAAVVLMALGLITTAAYAQSKSFSWTNPSLRVDGTDLLPADIAETRVYCNDIVVTTGAGSATSAIADLPVGSYSCYATTVDTNGLESDPSNTVTFEIIPGKPNPPVLSVE